LRSYRKWSFPGMFYSGNMPRSTGQSLCPLPMRVDFGGTTNFSLPYKCGSGAPWKNSVVGPLTSLVDLSACESGMACQTGNIIYIFEQKSLDSRKPPEKGATAPRSHFGFTRMNKRQTM